MSIATTILPPAPRWLPLLAAVVVKAVAVVLVVVIVAILDSKRTATQHHGQRDYLFSTRFDMMILQLLAPMLPVATVGDPSAWLPLYIMGNLWLPIVPSLEGLMATGYP